MPLINCEINIILPWLVNCFIIDASVENQVPTFTITDTELTSCSSYNHISSQDNAKLLQQLKLGFKRTNNWNKCQSKVTVQERNQYLNYLTDPSFQGVNRSCALSYENNTGRASYKRHYLQQLEIKDYNVMISGRKFSDQVANYNLRTYDNIQKIKTGQGGDYTTGCLLDYLYFKNYYKMIAIDLNK